MTRVLPKKLFIRFSTDLSDEIECLFVSEGSIELIHISLSDLSIESNDVSVIVLVPTVHLLLMQINLPRMKQSHLKKTIPFAVEEFITSDLSDLHVAFSLPDKTGKAPVGIIHHDLMRRWLEALDEVDIQPDIFLPDVLILPFKENENTWQIWVENEVALVRTDAKSGFAVDQANLEKLLALRLADIEKTKPESIVIMLCQDQAVSDDVGKVTGNLDIPIYIRTPEKSFLSFISKHVPDTFSFNLLQGDYAVKKRWDKLKRYWLVTFTLLIIWISLFFFKDIFLYGYLKHQQRTFQKQNIELYQEVFPKADQLVQAKRDLAGVLSRMRQVRGKNPFFSLISTSSPILKKNGFELRALAYQRGVLTLDVAGESLSALAKLQEQLRQQGLLVERKSTTQVDKKTISELIVRYKK